MGLRNWFAKNAGAEAYGDVMGRETLKNGLALGRTLFLGHGTLNGCPKHNQCVYEDAAAMTAGGYTLYAADELNPPPAENSSEFSLVFRALGIAFAERIALNAAHCFRREENRDSFNRAMGSSLKSYLDETHSDVRSTTIISFMNLQTPVNVTKMLNLERPGTGDVLEAMLEAARTNDLTTWAAFRRSGIFGFDSVSVPLAEQTILSIQKAAQDFGW
jgi:hypothetical protein